MQDTITCTWDCPSIIKQWFEIADNAAFTGSTVDTLVSLSQITQALTNNTTYYWRVKEENDQGYGPYSPVWQFTFNQKAIQITEPTSQAIWKAGSSRISHSQRFRVYRILL